MSVGLSPSDFISIPQFAWNVYKACRDTKSDYAALSCEVQSMHAMLREVGFNANKCNLSSESIERLALLMSGCRKVLEVLDNTLQRYDSLAVAGGSLKARARRTKDTLRWIVESPADIRMQIVSHIAMLAVFNSSLVIATSNSSQDRVQNQLVELFQKLGLHDMRTEIPQHNHQDGTSPSLPPAHQPHLGLVQTCWGCKALAKACGPGNPCPACAIADPRFGNLPCRRGPLTALSKDMIPEFFQASAHLFDASQIAPTMHSLKPSSASTHVAVVVYWGFIQLNLPMCISARQLDAALWSTLPNAIEDFQTTFPDKQRFRVRVIDQAMGFAEVENAHSNILKLASKFLVLALIISHGPVVQLVRASHHQSRPAEYSQETEPYDVIETQLQCVLSELLEETLRGVLMGLGALIFRQNRKDWPAICLSLCLLLFGVESMQVDVHLRTQTAETTCQSMEIKAVKVLTELFHASTSGFDPMSLDWDLDENKELLERDENSIVAMQRLQEVSQEYWTFLQERKHTRFSWSDTDCFTGKLVSEILMR